MKAKVLMTLALAGAASAQTGTLDQESPWEFLAAPVQGASFNLSASSLTWQAQIRAGADGQLEGIAIGTAGPVGAEAFIRIRAGEAWATGSTLFETTFVKATDVAETIFIDMTAADIMLSTGDVFVMETQGNDTGMNMLGTYVPPASGASAAYPEPLFLNTSLFSDDGWRHGFKTYMIDGGAECYADCDGSGELDFFDFLCFQNAFAASEPYADCDDNGEFDFFDFLCFQNEFAAGCP